MNLSNHLKPIPVAARSRAWFWGRSLAGIVRSNPAGVMDVCLLWRTDHSFTGILQRERERERESVCVCVCVRVRACVCVCVFVKPW
jgi:hypothetical protein